MAVRTDRHQRPFMSVRRVLEDVVDLTADAEVRERLLRRNADEADIAPLHPNRIEGLAVWERLPRLPRRLLDVDDLPPRPSRKAARPGATHDLRSAVVRVVFEHDS